LSTTQGANVWVKKKKKKKRKGFQPNGGIHRQVWRRGGGRKEGLKGNQDFRNLQIEAPLKPEKGGMAKIEKEREGKTKKTDYWRHKMRRRQKARGGVGQRIRSEN